MVSDLSRFPGRSCSVGRRWLGGQPPTASKLRIRQTIEKNGAPDTIQRIAVFDRLTDVVLGLFKIVVVGHGEAFFVVMVGRLRRRRSLRRPRSWTV